MRTLRQAIPSYCFKPLYRWGIYYVIRDLGIVTGLMAAAYYCIPMIDSLFARTVSWLCYGYIQGLFMTGIWVRRPFKFRVALTIQRSLGTSVVILRYSPETPSTMSSVLSCTLFF